MTPIHLDESSPKSTAIGQRDAIRRARAGLKWAIARIVHDPRGRSHAGVADMDLRTGDERTLPPRSFRKTTSKPISGGHASSIVRYRAVRAILAPTSVPGTCSEIDLPEQAHRRPGFGRRQPRPASASSLATVRSAARAPAEARVRCSPPTARRWDGPPRDQRAFNSVDHGVGWTAGSRRRHGAASDAVCLSASTEEIGGRRSWALIRCMNLDHRERGRRGYSRLGFRDSSSPTTSTAAAAAAAVLAAIGTRA
jgi:hypothetical protein